MRESSVRGPSVDLSEFERRLRASERRAASGADPLSELARLMEGDEQAPDPYSQILPDPRVARTTPPPVPQAPPPSPPAWRERLRGSYDAASAPAPDASYDESQADYAGYSDASSSDHAYEAEDYAASSQHYAEPGYDDQQYDPGYHGGAEGGWSDDSHYLDYGAEDEPAAPQRLSELRQRLRPWHAAVAIGVVAVSSIAWQFLHRSGVGGSKEIAVINAPEGPVKVKPIVEADQEGPGNNGAAVLDRKDATPVKEIVTHQEQAVDPTVSPKVVELGNGPVDAPHEDAVGTQPRRVKTVTVRPDGSRVEDTAVPPAAVDSPTETAPIAPAEVTTPKPTAKTVTTAQAAKPKPSTNVAMTEPAPVDGAAAPTGAGYAVQFGAANSEAEARTLLKTVSAKYGVKATFKPAKVNGGTIYRVRAANLTKDSANAICSKVKAAGGSCFVAAN